jgi:hypothetical protein
LRMASRIPDFAVITARTWIMISSDRAINRVVDSAGSQGVNILLGMRDQFSRMFLSKFIDEDRSD